MQYAKIWMGIHGYIYIDRNWGKRCLLAIETDMLPLDKYKSFVYLAWKTGFSRFIIYRGELSG